MLGAGSRHARARPGYGASSRLNRNIVEKNHNVQESTAFSINYSDSGLFGVYGIIERGKSNTYIASLSNEFQSLRQKGISAEELHRAKAQFKAHNLFDLSRSELMEFAARQISVGNPISPSDFYKGVDAVTAEDVKRVADKVFSSKSTISAIGEVSSVTTL